MTSLVRDRVGQLTDSPKGTFDLTEVCEMTRLSPLSVNLLVVDGLLKPYVRQAWPRQRFARQELNRYFKLLENLS